MDSETRAKVDLHIHSTASDGSLEPNAIAALAVEQGLAAISLTDHDTVAGVQQILASPIAGSLEFLSGIEISAAPPEGFDFQGSIHILGYGFNATDSRMLTTIEQLAQARSQRIPKIIDKLRKSGIDIDPDRVQRHIGKAAAGRPHVARVLVEMGIVKDVDTAFDLWLAKGRPAYVDKYRLPADRAIKTIRGAGGLAVLAHPYLIFKDIDNRLKKMIARLNQMGLEGLEVFYPKHPPEVVKALKDMARGQNLVITGGTDFHGAITPEIKLGAGTGNFQVPYHVFHNLKQRIAAKQQN